MEQLTTYESARIQVAIEGSITALSEAGILLHVRCNFAAYAAIRRTHGAEHLNQAFDPRETRFGHDDFWLLGENQRGEPIATFCLRRFFVEDLYALIRSQALWFSDCRRLVDPLFIVECGITPFGGEVCHGGGLWVREDYRGWSRLAFIMPRFARAIALRCRPFDHDSGMIRKDSRDRSEIADRKAVFMGKRAEAVDSLVVPRETPEGLHLEFRKRPLVNQRDDLVDTPTVGSEGQEQTRVRV